MRKWKQDWGLQSRMLLTMFLLSAVYLFFLVFLFSLGAELIFVLVFISFFIAIEYFMSDLTFKDKRIEV